MPQLVCEHALTAVAMTALVINIKACEFAGSATTSPDDAAVPPVRKRLEASVKAEPKTPDSVLVYEKAKKADLLREAHVEATRMRAARLCRPGGTLVYATCSLLHAENDAQVAAFLASDDGAEFELRPPDSFDAPLDGDVLRLTPARHGCDGFFAAVLRRKEGGWSRRGGRR